MKEKIMLGNVGGKSLAFCSNTDTYYLVSGIFNGD